MDLVVKIGGSLCKYPKELRELCRGLSEWLRGENCIVTPGGGPFADVVRQVQRVYALSDDSAHEMALLAVDQYGLMLSELIEGSVPVRTLAEAKKLSGRAIPVLLPSNLIMSSDSLEHSWDAGSDCIAAVVAKECGAKRLVLVKDVDGVHDPEDPSKILRRVPLSSLESMRTCLDVALARILKGTSLECVVVNGLVPQRVRAVIKGSDAVCTIITTT
ncbi:MAG: hypothetical protein LM598_01290 [Candidatus Verstraetearchaeota archaeon]|jgi:aspartokinase-like uncharacterized kinase|nr:hypothetical protein [Candidatus Verstraetearchaeota archaeon]